MKILRILPFMVWLSSPVLADYTYMQIDDQSDDSTKFGYVRVVEDISGDGLPDIVTVGEYNQVAWYEYPAWTLRNITSGFNSRSDDIEVADVDNDGHKDIIAVHNEPGQIKWIANPLPADPRVQGNWVVNAVGSVGDYVKDVDAADFNGDGKLDIAVRMPASLSVFIQGASFTFTRYDLSIRPNEGMDLGDLDGDGNIDIVLNGYWLENPYPSSFAAWTEHTIDSKWYNQSGGGYEGYQQNACKVVVADMNGDGRKDVLLSQSEKPDYPVSWYSSETPLVNGWTEHVITTSLDYVHTLQAADFDQDGDLDVLAGSMIKVPGVVGNVMVFHNLGDNQGIWTYTTLATTGIYSGVVGDIQADNDPDIVGVRRYDQEIIEYWRNNLAHNLTLDSWSYHQADNSRSSQAFGLALGDLTGDLQKDIAAGRYFYRNSGNLASWTRVDFGSPLDAMLITNVDGDQRGDVIAQNGSELLWLEANDAQGSSWNRVKVADVAAIDGHSNTQGYDTAQIVPGGREEIVLTLGNGTWYFTIPANPASVWPGVQIESGSNGEGMAAGDIDGDGYADVVGTGLDGSRWRWVRWWKNPKNGSSSWQQIQIGEVAWNHADRFAIADMNGDSRADVVVATEDPVPNGGTAYLYWFEAPADPVTGVWVRHQISQMATLNSMDIGDFDRDGDIDIVCGEHRGAMRVMLWANNGAGSFTMHLVDQGKENHLGTRVADLDLDGDLDLAGIAWDAYQYLHVWENRALLGGSQPECQNSSDCNDDDPCTGDTCSSGSCSHSPLSGPSCDDGIACTVGDICQGGVCSGGSPYNALCTARPDCLSAVCDATLGCQYSQCPYESSLFMWLPLDQDYQDDSDNHHAVSCSSCPTAASGRINGGYSFSNDALNFGALNVSSTGITLSAWIKPNVTSTCGPRIISKASGTAEADHYWMLGLCSNQIRFRLKAGGITRTLVGGSISTGIWQHVGATYDGSTMRIYKNGELVNSQAASGSIGSSSAETWVGHNPNADSGSAFDGDLDEIRIYQQALSEADLLEVMNGSGGTPIDVPPAAPANLRVE